MIPYVRAVLDVLGVKNGPSHGEVIITDDGPCLVEMNCRANGGNGTWQPLCRAIAGYSQIEAAVDAYLDKEKFDQLPDKYPSPFLAQGQLVDLVSYSKGTVKATPGFEVMKRLPSFVFIETHVKPGVRVVPTVDLVTDIGCVVMMHADKDVLERDIEVLRQMEKHNILFQYEKESRRSSGEEQPFTMLKDRHRIYSLDFKEKNELPQEFVQFNRRHRFMPSTDLRDLFNL